MKTATTKILENKNEMVFLKKTVFTDGTLTLVQNEEKEVAGVREEDNPHKGILKST